MINMNRIFRSEKEKQIFYQTYSMSNQHAVDNMLDKYPEYASRWYNKYIIGSERVYGRYESYLTSHGDAIYDAINKGKSNVTINGKKFRV